VVHYDAEVADGVSQDAGMLRIRSDRGVEGVEGFCCAKLDVFEEEFLHRDRPGAADERAGFEESDVRCVRGAGGFNDGENDLKGHLDGGGNQERWSTVGSWGASDEGEVEVVNHRARRRLGRAVERGGSRAGEEAPWTVGGYPGKLSEEVEDRHLGDRKSLKADEG